MKTGFYLVVWLLLLSHSQQSLADKITVASAANFYHTLKKIKIEFEKKTEHEITIIRGSTGKLYAQIMNGAPYDVFLSADVKRAEQLVKKGYSLNNTSKIYAVGSLVLWRPDMQDSEALKNILMSGDYNKLAIANPKTAPYGRAAMETLKSLGIFEKVKHKLVYAENIAQAHQFVDSGAADLGLIAKALTSQQIVWDINRQHHQPIAQSMLILKQSRHKKAAQAFYDFMSQPEVRTLIEQAGYAD